MSEIVSRFWIIGYGNSFFLLHVKIVMLCF